MSCLHCGSGFRDNFEWRNAVMRSRANIMTEDVAIEDVVLELQDKIDDYQTLNAAIPAGMIAGFLRNIVIELELIMERKAAGEEDAK